MNIKTYLHGLLLCFAIALLSLGCNDKEAEVPTDTLAAKIAARTDLSLFKAALTRVHFNIFTEGKGPFTILAPTDAAFKASGVNSVADINALDSNTLTTVLAYHIIPATRNVIDIPKGPNATIATQNGLTLYASKYTNATFINGVKFSESDIAASNGVLHIIDRLLIPPTGTTLSLLQSNVNFKLFVQAITRAAVTSTFTATGPITVFAPTNAAFIAAGLDSATISITPVATLSSIVRYHVLPLRLFSSEIIPASYKTSQGTNVSVVDASGLKLKGTSNTTNTGFLNLDFLVGNGVVHFIDGVLKP